MFNAVNADPPFTCSSHDLFHNEKGNVVTSQILTFWVKFTAFSKTKKKVKESLKF
jgi:hypothetical protein